MLTLLLFCPPSFFLYVHLSFLCSQCCLHANSFLPYFLPSIINPSPSSFHPFFLDFFIPFFHPSFLQSIFPSFLHYFILPSFRPSIIHPSLIPSSDVPTSFCPSIIHPLIIYPSFLPSFVFPSVPPSSLSYLPLRDFRYFSPCTETILCLVLLFTILLYFPSFVPFALSSLPCFGACHRNP